jgi:hypothetical protein
MPVRRCTARKGTGVACGGRRPLAARPVWASSHRSSVKLLDSVATVLGIASSRGSVVDQKVVTHMGLRVPAALS